MEICACMECRKLFNYLAGVQICPDCKEKLEKKFYEVNEFLYHNPGANMSQISESCDVKRAHLLQWVKEGRLLLGEDSELPFRCDGCGSAISSGSFCDDCKKNFLIQWHEMERQDHEQEPEPEEKVRDTTPRMRFRKR